MPAEPRSRRSDQRRRRGWLARPERAPALAFVASVVASIALFVLYLRGGQPQAEGVLLAVVLGGIGVGIALWANRFMPHGPFEEPRGQIGSSDAEVEAFVEDFEAGGEEIARRGFLAKLFAGAVGFLGLAALLPIRSLGPRPGRGLKVTPYEGGGKRLVRDDGTPVKPADVGVDGVITVWPEGNVNVADAPTLLIHLRSGQNKPREGRQDWLVDDLVAYSKLCSHMGCPVGLYQAQLGLLLCPCHQSTFDVGDGCRPIFGPATRSLPQLPLALDGQGYLIATGDFSSPVSAGFWDSGKY